VGYLYLKMKHIKNMYSHPTATSMSPYGRTTYDSKVQKTN